VEFAEAEHDDILDWVVTELPDVRVLAVGECMAKAAAVRSIAHYADAMAVKRRSPQM